MRTVIFKTGGQLSPSTPRGWCSWPPVSLCRSGRHPPSAMGTARGLCSLAFPTAANKRFHEKTGMSGREGQTYFQVAAASQQGRSKRPDRRAVTAGLVARAPWPPGGHAEGSGRHGRD